MLKNYSVINILGIRLHKISRPDLEKEIVSALSAKGRPVLFIATINPSFIMRAQKDEAFKDILNKKTTINVADGVGLKLADKNLEIITGVKITSILLSYAEKLGKSVLVVTKKDSLTPKTAIQHYFHINYPKLYFSVREEASLDVREHDVLLCALGEAAQEKFIVDNTSFIKPKVAVGIGGTFDVLIGTVRVPRTKYFGWVFRLLANPKRLPKIIKSVLIFPILVIARRNEVTAKQSR
ncbi:WecB/TagA/CpsF family glycosyltransferase [Patescibacteria group bacterium]|nr:WecB/TagA/CpsF family glycosyltransferase [Patescibacteria group bacterium]